MGRLKKKKPVEVIPVTANGNILPAEVIEAAKRVGFTVGQIAAFSSLEALKDAIYHLDPVARLRLEEQPVPKPAYPDLMKPSLVDKALTFTVAIDARWIVSANHAACEEMQIQSWLRAQRIRNIQSLSIVRPYVADKRGQLVSQVTVNYKEQA